MASEKPVADAHAFGPARPTVRQIDLADLGDAMAKGLADFKAMPTHLLFLCLIYPILTFVFARVYAGYDVLPLVFPLLAGYTLIGPLIAIGMYELSRRREQGMDTSRVHAFGVFRSPSIGAIATLGIVLMAVYFAWLGVAQAIYVQLFGGAAPTSVADFLRLVFATVEGWTLMVVGSGIGFLFAAAVFSLSVVSFPMLLDRDVGAVTAVQTSVRAVRANPVMMAIWGVIVAGALLVGSLPLFVGLSVVLPVLGHATWHLYRKLVAP